MSHISRAISLSLIEKDESAQEEFLKEVESILAYVADLQQISPVASKESPEQVNVFREDEVTVPDGTYTEQMLAQAPAYFKRWFLSKKIL